MKHLMMIAALVLPVSTGYSASTLTREIPTTSRFSREAFTNETAATWRAKLGVTAGGAATNAISDTNGIGVGLHEFDGVLATNYWGGGSGLTNIPESGVTGLPADLSSKTGTNETRAVIHTNAANTFRGTFYGDGSGLTGISGGGSASNVFFYPGNNITWSTVGGSNQANVTGTLSVDTTGTAGGLSAAVAQSLVTGLPADLSGKSGTNETRAIIHTNAANQFRGTFVGDGTAISGTLTNNTTGNAATATLSTNAVNATNLFGSITESQVTGLVTDLAGKVAVAPGNSIQTRTNSGAVIPELTGQTNVWNVMNYGAESYPANSTTAFNAAGTNLTFAGGTMWVPRAVYGITGTVALQGGLASGMPVAAFDYGNYKLSFDKHARVYCDVGTTNAFLFRTAAGQWRKVEVEDGSLNGTNTTGALLPTQVGMAFDGPSGNMKVARMNVQQMGVGFLVDDVTGVEFDNIMGIGCNVGFAWGYKPDGVEVVNSTFRNNRWGTWTMFTNAQFTTVTAQEGYPTFRNTVFGYNTNGAALLAYGMLMLDGCYFESNGVDTNSNVAVQIGYDTSDPYQQSYTNNAPSSSKPRLIWRNNGLNYKHAVKVYDPKGAEIYMYGPKIEGAAIPVVRLMVAGADNSIIRSDVNSPLWITNSSGTWFSVPMGYMFVSNAIVPISGMASTNLTDSTNLARLNGTNVFTGTNAFMSNVGIGTNTPSVPLHIFKTSPTANERLFVVATSENADRFVVDEDGDVETDGNLISSGTVYAGASSPFTHIGKNTYRSPSDGTVQWTKNDGTTTLMSNTNGLFAIPGSLVISSNSATNVVILDNGQMRLAWSGDVDTLPSVITKDAAGTLKTNALLNTTNVALLTGTNVFTGTNTFAEAIVTNLIFIPTAWTGTTNTLNLNGSYQFYATANDLAITNLSGITAGQATWTTLRISNSSASTIVARNLVGSTVRLQGAASTNALSIPSAKVGFMSFLFAGDTNSLTTVQQ